ncbi:MAG: hypothetical protein ACPMAQ_07510 [Phycisphaerae bacterium]
MARISDTTDEPTEGIAPEDPGADLAELLGVEDPAFDQRLLDRGHSELAGVLAATAEENGHDERPAASPVERVDPLWVLDAGGVGARGEET